MTTFSNIIGQLEGFAAVAWEKAKEEAVEFEQKILPIIETDLVNALTKFGEFAVQEVVSLMGEKGAGLKPGEKLNLLATSLRDEAAKAGTELKDHIVTAVAETAFTTVMGQASTLEAARAAQADAPPPPPVTENSST